MLFVNVNFCHFFLWTEITISLFFHEPLEESNCTFPRKISISHNCDIVTNSFSSKNWERYWNMYNICNWARRRNYNEAAKQSLEFTDLILQIKTRLSGITDSSFSFASHFCSKQPNAAKKVKFLYHCAVRGFWVCAVFQCCCIVFKLGRWFLVS